MHAMITEEPLERSWAPNLKIYRIIAIARFSILVTELSFFSNPIPATNRLEWGAVIKTVPLFILCYYFNLRYFVKSIFTVFSAES